MTRATIATEIGDIEVELYDQSAFDPAYDSAPLEFFEPMVRRLFERPINSMYKAVGEAA